MLHVPKEDVKEIETVKFTIFLNYLKLIIPITHLNKLL